MIRHGDIYLLKVDDVLQPAEGQSKPLIVGHGEETGHMHTIVAARTLTEDELAWNLFAQTGEWQAQGDPLIAVDVDTEITHQEHDTLPVPAGVYRVIRKREYQPEAIRFIAD